MHHLDWQRGDTTSQPRHSRGEPLGRIHTSQRDYIGLMHILDQQRDDTTS